MNVERRAVLLAAGRQTAQAYFVVQEAAPLDPQMAFSRETASAAMRTAHWMASRVLEQ